MTEITAAVDRTNNLSMSSLHKLPVWLLPTVLLLGLLSGYVGERIVYANRELYYKAEPGFPPHPPEYLREQMWNMIANYSIGFGSFGAMLIGAIGLCVGLTVSPARTIIGLLIGALAGLVVGAVTGSTGYLIAQELMPSHMESTFKAMMIFGPLWLALGLTVGLLVAVIRGRPMRVAQAMFIGLMAGCLATVAIPFIAAIAFPTSRPEVITPDHYWMRLMSYMVGAACLVLAAVRILSIHSTNLTSTRA